MSRYTAISRFLIPELAKLTNEYAEAWHQWAKDDGYINVEGEDNTLLTITGSGEVAFSSRSEELKVALFRRTFLPDNGWSMIIHAGNEDKSFYVIIVADNDGSQCIYSGCPNLKHPILMFQHSSKTNRITVLANGSEECATMLSDGGTSRRLALVGGSGLSVSFVEG